MADIVTITNTGITRKIGADILNDYFDYLKKYDKIITPCENCITEKQIPTIRAVADRAAKVAFPEKIYDFGLGSIDFNEKERNAFSKGYEQAILDLKLHVNRDDQACEISFEL